MDNFLREIESWIIENFGKKDVNAFYGICERYAGNTVYVPSHTEIFIKRRNAEIKNKFKGNYFELAQEYGLSESQVRRIVNG